MNKRDPFLDFWPRKQSELAVCGTMMDRILGILVHRFTRQKESESPVSSLLSEDADMHSWKGKSGGPKK